MHALTPFIIHYPEVLAFEIFFLSAGARGVPAAYHSPNCYCLTATAY